MHTYEVRIIVEGHSTVVRIRAYSSGEATKIALAQYGGTNARAIATNQVKS